MNVADAEGALAVCNWQTDWTMRLSVNEAVKGTPSSAAFCLRAYLPAAEVLLLLNVDVMWPRDASIFLFLER